MNEKVVKLPIKNFKSDWKDGKAIGALVDAVAPGTCNLCSVSSPLGLRVTFIVQIMVYQEGQKHRYGSTRIGAFDLFGTQEKEKNSA